MLQDIMTMIDDKNLGEIIKLYPVAEDFLDNFRLNSISRDLPLSVALEDADEEVLNEFGLDKQSVLMNFSLFLKSFMNTETSADTVDSITIVGGFNKFKEPESISLTISSGEIVSIVGPTGSGKSRLLGDIECIAQGDTPTGRKIFINGLEVDEEKRFKLEGKLIAQLSQNMNFVMDLTVREFLEMHARSRQTPDPENIIKNCFLCANNLAGEEFSENTKVTQLSGGQSRALMIADTAFISESPIVLIDEIENAGINRRQAIELLAKNNKIIFVSTHDPLLAINADKRIVIKNGGIHKVIRIPESEKGCLSLIEDIDNTLMTLRSLLRSGETITEDLLKC